MYRYFIVYGFKSEKEIGFGNEFLTCNTKIKEINDIKEIERKLEEKNNFESECVLLNYILLS